MTFDEFNMASLMVPPPGAGESSSAHAARVIREAILKGVLVPGTVISQGGVAEVMGVSRIPVRDALRQLESEGLVQIPSNRAARVSIVDLDELRDLYDMRELIESYAITKSVPRLSQSTLERISVLAELFDARVQSETEVLSIDREFHLLTMSAAPSARLHRFITEMLNASQHYRRAYWAHDHEHQYHEISQDHHELVRALVARDAELASEIARRHLGRTRALLESRLDG